MRSKSFFCVLCCLAALAAPAFGKVPLTENYDPSASNAGLFGAATTVQPEGTAVNPPVDFNGDGRSDWAVVRNSGGVYSWFIATTSGAVLPQVNWGVTGDRLINGDFDGDLRDDIAVFRPSTATFYILNSQTSTLRIDNFGQNGDDPTVVGDYNNDGRDDVAVYRPGTPAMWFYRPTPGGGYVQANWGQDGDFPAPGDYDGDGEYDFAIQRPTGANGVFWIQRSSDGGFIVQTFGGSGDLVVPGDYDGDGKTDIATVATQNGVLVWFYKPSATPSTAFVSRAWGLPTDFVAQGDYDGDRKTDFCVWRPGAVGVFYVSSSGTGSIFTQNWGTTGDLPVARFNAH